MNETYLYSHKYYSFADLRKNSSKICIPGWTINFLPFLFQYPSLLAWGGIHVLYFLVRFPCIVWPLKRREKRVLFSYAYLCIAIFKLCLLTSNTKHFLISYWFQDRGIMGFSMLQILMANQKYRKIPNPYNYVSRIRLNKFGAAIYFCAILHYFTWPHFRGVWNISLSTFES